MYAHQTNHEPSLLKLRILPREKYEWFLDLQRNGIAKNSGFTLRFDLMFLFLAGLTNVGDVIPFPRSYGIANN
ncbi:hypothetical protein HN51_039919 [Arachis hypogaea]